MPGPSPKPTRLKALAGNPGHRPLNADPEFSGTPVAPEWLSKEARREWRRVVPSLVALDLIRSVDTAALASYCVSYARWKEAEQLLDREGSVIDEPVVSKAGEIVAHRKRKHPAQAVAKDAQAAMHKAASAFGFSPADRTRISMPEKAPEDALASFLNSFGTDATESDSKPC